LLVKCSLLTNSASYGGGADGGTLNDCALTGNSGAYSGGGAAYAILNNCLLMWNQAGSGGAVAYSTLNDCSLAANVGTNSAGGAFDSTLNNCLAYYNVSSSGTNFDSTSTLNYCCTTPLPALGIRNITNEPLVKNWQGGDLHLQTSSPCINAGANLYVSASTDLDGKPRIVSGTVDIGAYEFQGTGSIISYAWLEQYGLPTDGSADFLDPDGDGANNYQEWRCGTDPTNALSALRLLAPAPSNPNIVVRWQSVAGVTYFLERSVDLSSVPAFTRIASGLVGQAGTTTYVDATPPYPGPAFYRVGVGN
jgi:hypothetical protein